MSGVAFGPGYQPTASAPSGSSQSGIPNAVAPICIECANTAELVGGKCIYPHRPDLFDRWFWLCQCGAYCGTHKGSTEPLGYPCGPTTRIARSAAHAAFDPLWRGPGAPMSRGRAYRWLSKKMKMRRADCHIGMMDAERACQVVEFAANFRTAKWDGSPQGGDGLSGSVHDGPVPEGDAPAPSDGGHHDNK